MSLCDEWQPIETAPKNPEGEPYGPWILIYHKFDGGIYMVRHQFDENGNRFWKRIGPGEFARNSISNITHWIPLPEPPQ